LRAKRHADQRVKVQVAEVALETLSLGNGADKRAAILADQQHNIAMRDGR
jgi:hypothetical protein